MTMAMQAVQIPQAGPKVLRIGLIQNGRIVEERIIGKRETVTVGTSEKNHFAIGGDGVPSRFEVFQVVGNDYILNFTEQMSGRVGLPGGVQDLEQLRKSGAARNAGTHFQVKLSDSSRGKVVIANTTLLFQFVSPPPVQPIVPLLFPLDPYFGPPSTANGLVFAQSLYPNTTINQFLIGFDLGVGPGPNMHIFNAQTGSRLWSHTSDQPVMAGAVIADGKVYWGTGFIEERGKLHRFGLP